MLSFFLKRTNVPDSILALSRIDAIVQKNFGLPVYYFHELLLFLFLERRADAKQKF